MSDIVARLRGLHVKRHPSRSVVECDETTILEAADRIEQLSVELEREKREAERAQDAHGVRFLNYLEETARLTDRIERLEKEIKTAIRQFEDGNRLECHRTLCTVIYGKQY